MDFELDRTERRVIGTLIEKALSTPEYYPMTATGLSAGCNQRNNRDPVLTVRDFEIEGCLKALFVRGLVVHARGDGARALRYAEKLSERLGLEIPERAVLAELLLRGPQTTGELRGHCERMHAFRSLEEVAAVLDRLAGRSSPLARLLPRAPGERVAKWTDLLSPSRQGAGEAAPAPPVPAGPAAEPREERGATLPADPLRRLEAIEAEVARLAALVEELRARA